MDKSPLVEVLGSFASNVVTEKNPCIDMGVRFSVNFGCRKIYRKISCVFVGTGIGMPMYSGNKFFMKLSHSKFSSMKHSQETAGSITPWPVVGHILLSSS